MQMACSEAEQFNESIIVLLSRKQDLQKQSLDMTLNMTRWHEYDNVIEDITIYDEKNMDLADWLTTDRKSSCIDKQSKIWISNSEIIQYPIQNIQNGKWP